MNKKILKIDIDGVIRNIIPEFLHIYNDEFNQSKHIYTEFDINNFDFKKCLPDFKMEYKDFFIKYSHIFKISKPYNLALKGLIKLHRDYKIILVSNQYPGNEKITDEWLKEYNIVFDEVIYTENKNEIDGWVILDDNINNLKESNSIPICMSRQWNKTYSGYTVDNLFDFYEILKYIDK